MRSLVYIFSHIYISLFCFVFLISHIQKAHELRTVEIETKNKNAERFFRKEILSIMIMHHDEEKEKYLEKRGFQHYSIFFLLCEYI